VSCGCFWGRIDKFEEAVKKTHDGNIHAKKYTREIQNAKLLFSEKTNV
jgi:hypothetical protein